MTVILEVFNPFGCGINACRYNLIFIYKILYLVPVILTTNISNIDKNDAV